MNNGLFVRNPPPHLCLFLQRWVFHHLQSQSDGVNNTCCPLRAFPIVYKRISLMIITVCTVIHVQPACAACMWTSEERFRELVVPFHLLCGLSAT